MQYWCTLTTATKWFSFNIFIIFELLILFLRFGSFRWIFSYFFPYMASMYNIVEVKYARVIWESSLPMMNTSGFLSKILSNFNNKRLLSYNFYTWESIISNSSVVWTMGFKVSRSILDTISFYLGRCKIYPQYSPNFSHQGYFSRSYSLNQKLLEV